MQCVNAPQFIIIVTWNCLIIIINLTLTKHYNKKFMEVAKKLLSGDSDRKHAVNKWDLQYAIIYRLSGVWFCAWHRARRCVEVPRNIIAGCIQQRAVFLELQVLEVGPWAHCHIAHGCTTHIQIWKSRNISWLFQNRLAKTTILIFFFAIFLSHFACENVKSGKWILRQLPDIYSIFLKQQLRVCWTKHCHVIEWL
jgi:hypothetical protein